MRGGEGESKGERGRQGEGTGEREREREGGRQGERNRRAGVKEGRTMTKEDGSVSESGGRERRR